MIVIHRSKDNLQWLDVAKRLNDKGIRLGQGYRTINECGYMGVDTTATGFFATDPKIIADYTGQGIPLVDGLG